MTCHIGIGGWPYVYSQIEIHLSRCAQGAAPESIAEMAATLADDATGFRDVGRND